MTSEDSEVKNTQEFSAEEINDQNQAVITEEEQDAVLIEEDGTAPVDVGMNGTAVFPTLTQTRYAEEIGAALAEEELPDLAGTGTISMDAVTMQDDRKTRVTETVTETIAMNPVSSGDTVSADGAQDGGEAAGGETEAEPEEPETDPETEAIKQRIRERKREKRRKARIRKARFWTILSLMLFVIAGLIFSLSSFFTVDLIEVEGNSHFTDEEIINIAHAVPGHNLIYNPDKTSIKEYLEQNPYIKSAEVTRKLPSTLVITVEERKQACYFKYDDDYLVIDNEGILLKKTRTEPKTTTVTGLVVTRMKLGETIGTENQQMFSRLMKLIRQIEKADLYFVKIDMSDYEDDQAVSAYIYSKLVVKSDYDTLMQNLKNGRLHKVVEKLFDDGVKRGTITLSGDDDISFEPGI